MMKTKKYFVFDGIKEEPFAVVEALTLYDAQLRIEEEKLGGGSYSWIDVEPDKYYDIEIQDERSRSVYCRLKPWSPESNV